MNSCVKGVSALAAVLLAFAASAEPFADGDTVVFLGDSITHGGRYHEFIADFYRTRYPERRIRFVNSGIGGDSAVGAMKRIKEAECHKTTFQKWEPCYSSLLITDTERTCRVQPFPQPRG